MRTVSKPAVARILASCLILSWFALPASGATTLVAAGSTYADPGFAATDNYDGDITGRVVTTSTVNTSQLGTYSVTYNVTDSSGNSAKPVSRTVKVADWQKPVISLLGDATLTLAKDSSFVDPGATAQDNYDGDISAKIVRTGSVNTAVPGSYSVKYNVSDSSGNAAAAVVRTVMVVSDTTKPVIKLKGSYYVRVKSGTPYYDVGATATDNEDGDITSKMQVTNTVNIFAPGVYKVTYNVKDSNGNAADTVTRTVRVTFWSKTDEDENSLFITAPLNGSTCYAPTGMGAVTLALTAHAPLETESVQFALDGVVIGSSTTPPYTVATQADPAAAGWGEHHVTATATLSSGATLEDESTFTLSSVKTGDDVNQNGLADNPFATLPADGDVWLNSAVVSETSGKRVTAMARIDGLDEGDDSDSPVVLVVSDASGAVTSVTVPRSLLSEVETGVVIVQMASDLVTLLGPAEAGKLAPEPEGQVFVKGGVYLEVNVLTSTDDGVTFDELNESRLLDHSVYVEMQGIKPSVAPSVSLYQHPLFVDSDPASGVAVLAQEGSWNTSGVRDLTVESDWVQARLTSLSLIAPYEPITSTKTDNGPGCAGGTLNGIPTSHSGGDLLMLLVTLLALVFGGGKAALRGVRATQRP